MLYFSIAVVAIFVFLYSVSAGKLEKTVFGGAVLFSIFGLVFGPMGIGFLEGNATAGQLRIIAEMTLALVLFAEAAKADLNVLSTHFLIPQRLITVALPLIIVLGIVFGGLIFSDLLWLEIAILATLLAPTDAALGKAVVTNKAVPAKIREGLNLESGLNDGVCVPIFLVFLALATEKAADGVTNLALKLVITEIGIGALVGVGLTLAGSWGLHIAYQRKWITETWENVTTIALAVACFMLAQALHGSGFIAAFVGGLVFGYVANKEKHELLLAAEGTGDTFALLTWVIFGGAVIGQSIGQFTWETVVYSALSLTVIRMLPVYLSLYGMDMPAREKLFIGWFGPRGLASVVFVVIVFNNKLPGGDVIVSTAVCTIILSVLGHGLTAIPLANWLAGRNQNN